MGLLHLPTELLQEIVSWIIASQHGSRSVLTTLHAFGLVHPRIWAIIEHSLYTFDVKVYGGSSLLWAAATGEEATFRKAFEIKPRPNTEEALYQEALSTAARFGHLRIVELLLDCDVELIPNNNDVSGQDPLFLAVIEGHTAVVELLLEKRPLYDLDLVDYTGRTPLFYAARWGHTEIVDLLLRKGANLGIGDFKGSYIEGTAAEHGHVDTLKFLLDYNMSLLENPNVANHTPLSLAVKNGHLDVVEMLLEYGANMNTQNETGRTPLMLATQARHVEIAKRLVQAGVDVNAIDIFNATSLFYAIEQGLEELATLYISRGGELPSDKYHWLIHAVSQSGYMNSLRLLLDMDQPCSLTDRSMVFYDALHAAVKYKQDDLVDRLLAKDCPVDPERPSRIYDTYFRKTTPLWLAVQRSDQNLVRKLLEHGANPNVFIRWSHPSTRGRGIGILLNLAIIKGNDEITKSLIDYGAKMVIADFDKITPLHRAVQKGKLDLVRHMFHAFGGIPFREIEKMADDLKHIAQGLLKTAIGKNDLAMVRLLLENGVDPIPLDLRRASGRSKHVKVSSPSVYALERGREEIADLLDEWRVKHSCEPVDMTMG